MFLQELTVVQGAEERGDKWSGQAKHPSSITQKLPFLSACSCSSLFLFNRSWGLPHQGQEQISTAPHSQRKHEHWGSTWNPWKFTPLGDWGGMQQYLSLGWKCGHPLVLQSSSELKPGEGHQLPSLQKCARACLMHLKSYCKFVLCQYRIKLPAACPSWVMFRTTV